MLNLTGCAQGLIDSAWFLLVAMATIGYGDKASTQSNSSQIKNTSNWIVQSINVLMYGIPQSPQTQSIAVLSGNSYRGGKLSKLTF